MKRDYLISTSLKCLITKGGVTILFISNYCSEWNNKDKNQQCLKNDSRDNELTLTPDPNTSLSLRFTQRVHSIQKKQWRDQCSANPLLSWSTLNSELHAPKTKSTRTIQTVSYSEWWNSDLRVFHRSTNCQPVLQKPWFEWMNEWR